MRAEGESVAWEDADRLITDAERRREDLARLAAANASRREEREKIEKDLSQVRAGILPLPPEVEKFRARLRTEGVAHDLLLEAVELRDVVWQPAIEGLLGRYRFAVLVRDLTSWSRAAALARESEYPHGVLAPDVRGHSPLDEASVFPKLEIQDPDYRALLARLLRTVVAGEPSDPILPTPRGELLASTGFLVSRIEARHVAAETIYLGREALQRRAHDLEQRLLGLEGEEADALLEDGKLRRAIEEIEARIRAQTARSTWESARGRHAELGGEAAQLRAELERRATEITGKSAEIDTIDEELGPLQKEIGSEGSHAQAARDGGEIALHERDTAERDLGELHKALGRLLAEPLPELDAATRVVLDEGLALATLRAQLNELERRAAVFTDDERDPMLPVNFERQTNEVAAVDERLRQLAKSVDDTQEAAERAQADYHRATRLVFRGYFARLAKDAEQLGFRLEGALEDVENGRFKCEVRVGIDQKSAVHYTSPELSGGQKAALSILMAMTAVSLESDGAGFFLVDEPFSASDVYKINELGEFLEKTGAQYLVSMPTSSDIAHCGDWLSATWTSAKSPGGFNNSGRPVLAPPVKLGFARGARDG